MSRQNFNPTRTHRSFNCKARRWMRTGKQLFVYIVCDNIDGPCETRYVRCTRAGVAVVKTPAADETMACSSSFSARLDIVRGLRSVLLVPIEDY